MTNSKTKTALSGHFSIMTAHHYDIFSSVELSILPLYFIFGSELVAKYFTVIRNTINT